MKQHNTHRDLWAVSAAITALALLSVGCESATQPLSRAVDPTVQAGDVSRPQNQLASPGRDSHVAGREHATARDPGCGCGKTHACVGKGSPSHLEQTPDKTKRQTCAGSSDDEVCAPGHAAGSSKEAPSAGFTSPPPIGAKARCPVMGNDFAVEEASARSEYKGRHYAFCCPGCKPKFDAAPEKYL